MSEKKRQRLSENHPDYEAYKREFFGEADAFGELYDQIEAKYRNSSIEMNVRALAYEINLYRKEHHKRLNRIMEKYSHCYEEIDMEEYPGF